MRMFKSVRIAMLVWGAAALVFGGAAAVESEVFARGAVSAEGTVVRLDWHVDMRRVRSTSGYEAVVRYRRPDGRTAELVDEAGSDPPAYSVGEKVRVLYDPADPSAAKIDDFRSLWLVPVAALVAGALALGVLAVMRSGTAGSVAPPQMRMPELPELPREIRPAPAPGFALRIAYCIPAWCWPFLLFSIAQGDWSTGGLDSNMSLAIFFVCNLPAVHGWLRGRLAWIEMLTLALVAPFLLWTALVLRT